MAGGAPKDRSDEFFGESTHTYSRAEAIRDGVLVDVSSVAREIGFDAPFAVTKALHDVVAEIPHGLQFLLWIAFAEVVADAHVRPDPSPPSSSLDFSVRLLNEESDALRIAIDRDEWTLGFVDDF